LNLVADILGASFALHLSKAELPGENRSAGKKFFLTGSEGI
jgi:hypothetical protein